MPLTDVKVRNAKPGEKPYRLADSGGLYLEVTPKGGRYWRMAYRFAGKRKLLAIGVYPDVSLALARERRDAARKQVAAGTDPSAAKKVEKRESRDRASNTFQAISDEWVATHGARLVEGSRARLKQLLKRDILPAIGREPIATLTPPQILEVARKVQARGALDTAHQVIGLCGQVCRYAVATGRAVSDPTRDLRGALPPAQTVHRAAPTDPKVLGEVLRKIEACERMSFPVKQALRLAPLLLVRPGELRQMRWAEVNLESEEWRFRVTKTSIDHIVPLPKQAVAILREMHLLTARGTYVFPNLRDYFKPMNENTLCLAMRTAGITRDVATVHGFRAVARTQLDEVLGYRPDLIEHQLAHAVRDPNGRAYNRTRFLDERKIMLQGWADYLDRVRTGADVVELGQRRREAGATEANA